MQQKYQIQEDNMSVVKELKCQNSHLMHKRIHAMIGPDPALRLALHKLPHVFFPQCLHDSCVNTHKGPDLKQTLMKVIIHCPTNLDIWRQCEIVNTQ